MRHFKVLVIGGGGREHALAYSFSKSPLVEKVYVAPGNPGMKDCAEIINIDVLDFEKQIQFVKEHQITYTFVGPEVPLVHGIVDAFEKENLLIFGPRKNAAIIEGSKQFAKDLMKKYNIPTAFYETFTNVDEAKYYIQKMGAPIVLKQDGLAAGKGVVVAMTLEEALSSIEEMFTTTDSKVVIEEYLEGEEFSLMAFVNNEDVYPMVIAQDHKRAYDDDLGPNTGGMGAYSPVPQISDDIVQNAIDLVMKPTAKAMVLEGRPFTGILYGGLMLTKAGIKTIEFNARFGDPETEVILPRLESDLSEIIFDLLNNKKPTISWSDDATIGVVLASIGYPKEYIKNAPITIPDNIESTVYHMGTTKIDSTFYTSGGRVLIVVEKGKNLKSAQEKVYNEISKIKCESLFYRKDIGNKAIRKR